MALVIEATFDGTVFRPMAPVALEPNTPVRLTVEILPPTPGKQSSFLETARSLQLEGPPDWSTNLDNYLLSADESLKRMEAFDEQKDEFIAAVRKDQATPPPNSPPK